ncbi:MAG: hypothetical protein WD467_01350 [Candidatus Saccharimonadales bacterium]
MFEWLSNLLPENINININIVKHVKINSDNTNLPPVSIEDDKLVISDSTPEGRDLAERIIKELPLHIEHNDIVIEEANLESYREIDAELSEADFENELDKFRPMIPKGDVPMLEVAILVKIRFDSGKNVGPIKGQAIHRYGPRAGMICNLYSSGYFHNLIKPLYESIKSGEIGFDEYLEIYKTIVTESPLAMFVGLGTPADKMKEQLLDKIELNKKSGIGYLHIHGIGVSNTRFIKRLLTDEDIKNHFAEDPDLILTGRALKATIYLTEVE